MKNRRILALVLAIMLVVTFAFNNRINIAWISHAETSMHVRSGVTSLRVRETPGGDQLTDDNGNEIYLDGGKAVTVLDDSNSRWYKVTFSYRGSQYTGYVSSDYLESGDYSESYYEEPDVLSDEEFEEFLSDQGFPSSYKRYLREIHQIHPTWTFLANHTGIDWATLMENERSKKGQVKNLVQGPWYNPHYSWRSTEVGYDPYSDTWYPYDGSDWFAVGDALLAYYMDPRTYMYENYIFAFESLSYQPGLQNRSGVEAILRGSFMYDSVPDDDYETYSEIIMEAAADSGVSPYHIAARIKQEMGDEPGVAALGDSDDYPGIYNFYNIGAYDSSNAVLAGIRWAAQDGEYGRPWDSVRKSIYGGAEFLGESYINRGQDTLYTQKFNVTNTSSLFSHQYMSNVQVVASESYSQYYAYATNGLLDSSVAFEIPVYLNMPDYIEKPDDSGNPNACLEALSVSGYSITPSFAYNTYEYSLIVESGCSDIEIYAEAVSGSASVSGDGVRELSYGTNEIPIKVTAENGSSITYTLTVVRKGSAGNGSSGQKPSATTEKTPEKTTEQKPVEKIRRGDLNNDGKISALDIVYMKRLIVGMDEMTDEKKKLGDVNGDGKVGAIDIVLMKRHIVGIDTITW